VNSSARQFYEDGKTGAGYREVPNETPTGVSVFPNDFRSVRAFAERSNNIVHWSQMDRGGALRGLGRAGPARGGPADLLPPVR
jgi:hypothetical protein